MALRTKDPVWTLMLSRNWCVQLIFRALAEKQSINF